MAPSLLTIRRFASTSLGNVRDIHVCLPQGYCAGSGRRFPVLYLHDGQNLFEDARAYAGTAWHIHRTVAELTAAGRMEPVILVGIDHGGVERLAEFAHQDGSFEGRPVIGRGVQYENFLVDELKPYIDQHFLTRLQPEHTAVMGSSMGGLVSLNMGLRCPDVFGMVGALSPSLWWQAETLASELSRQREVLSHLRLWLDIGGREGGFGHLVPGFAERIRQLLGGEQGRFRYHYDATGEHSEVAWGARVHLPLLFFFGTERERAGRG